jgi:molybdopterin synthase sulfur carrier subunit
MPMALVSLRGPLRKLVGGQARLELEGGTVLTVLRDLERRHPEITGWVLDERGQIRRHINVYINGEKGREETPVGERDRVDVLPAITGGGI